MCGAGLESQTAASFRVENPSDAGLPRRIAAAPPLGQWVGSESADLAVAERRWKALLKGRGSENGAEEPFFSWRRPSTWPILGPLLAAPASPSRPRVLAVPYWDAASGVAREERVLVDLPEAQLALERRLGSLRAAGGAALTKLELAWDRLSARWLGREEAARRGEEVAYTLPPPSPLLLSAAWAGQAGAQLNEGIPYYEITESAQLPLIPPALMWMLNASQAKLRGTDLDPDVPRALGDLVAVSYCNVTNIRGWNCSRCADAERRVAGRAGGVDLPEALRDAPGAPLPPAQPFALRKVVFDEDWDLLGFVGWSPALKAVVVAFRGTDSRSVYNWASNMRTWRTDLALAVRSAPPGALVHGGFFLSYNSSSLAGGVTEAVLELLDQHPGAPVYATGHSMGGALATICALDLRLSHDLPDVRLYTYGSPRVGNAIFQAWVLEVVKVRKGGGKGSSRERFDPRPRLLPTRPSRRASLQRSSSRRNSQEHWRFTHNRDLVPSVPPVLMGFSHLARELWMVDYAAPNCTLVGYCDDSGEDVLCHNSVCHLGLCSSIADHLVYLSPMFTPHPQGC